MKFRVISLLVFLIILISSIFLVINNGSRNTPLQKHDEKNELPLTDDPIVRPFDFDWFNFDFKLPEFNIPGIGPVLGLAGTGLWIIFFVLILMVFLVITSMILSRKKTKRSEKEVDKEEDKRIDKELEIRRQTLGRRIEEIIRFLGICLETNPSQGITEGFEKLDAALKEYSKISRPGWLTPREFTLLKIPYFNHEAMMTAVELFYRITYGQKAATKEHLEKFIDSLKLMIIDKKTLKWKADSPPVKEGYQ